MTIIPNFSLTGIVAMIFGVLVTVWAAAFVRRKYGATVLFLLSITLFLVGGGFAPIFLTILASATATRIDKPLTWWGVHLPDSTKNVLAKSWPWSIISFMLAFWSTFAVQICGSPFGLNVTIELVITLSITMVALMPVAVVSGLAADIKGMSGSRQAPLILHKVRVARGL